MNTVSKFYCMPLDTTHVFKHQFLHWKNLETIFFNQKCRRIEDYAFSGCISLQKIMNLRKDCIFSEYAFAQSNFYYLNGKIYRKNDYQVIWERNV